jgi:hypothetical protein
MRNGEQDGDMLSLRKSNRRGRENASREEGVEDREKEGGGAREGEGETIGRLVAS